MEGGGGSGTISSCFASFLSHIKKPPERPATTIRKAVTGASKNHCKMPREAGVSLAVVYPGFCSLRSARTLEIDMSAQIPSFSHKEIWNPKRRIAKHRVQATDTIVRTLPKTRSLRNVEVVLLRSAMFTYLTFPVAVRVSILWLCGGTRERALVSRRRELGFAQ